MVFHIKLLSLILTKYIEQLIITSNGLALKLLCSSNFTWCTPLWRKLYANNTPEENSVLLVFHSTHTVNTTQQESVQVVGPADGGGGGGGVRIVNTKSSH